MPCGCLSPTKLFRCYSVTRRTKALPDGVRPTLSIAQVQRDMIRLRRVLMIDGQRRVTALFNEHMQGQIEAVATEGLRRLSKKAVETELVLGGQEEVWADVLQELFGPNAHVEVIKQYTPVAQSIIARSYDKTCAILAEEQAHDASVESLRRARAEVAQRVKWIDETTRERIRQVIVDAVKSGESASGVARALREAVPEIATNRLPTIARTEVGNLIDQGIKQAVKESSVVKTVCVIGCKAVEPGIPTYNGRPTCNITGVPAYDADKLQFHPNHTGAVVAETFHE